MEGTALDMVVCNTKFRKRVNHLITYSSVGTSSQIDYRYFLISRNDFKRIQDDKVILSEEIFSQHRLLVCDIGLARDPGHKVYVPKRRVWLLKDDVYKERFKREVDNFALGV